MWTASLIYTVACMAISVLVTLSEWLAETWESRQPGDRRMEVIKQAKSDFTKSLPLRGHASSSRRFRVQG
jgi:hypothetical protein